MNVHANLLVTPCTTTAEIPYSKLSKDVADSGSYVLSSPLSKSWEGGLGRGDYDRHGL